MHLRPKTIQYLSQDTHSSAQSMILAIAVNLTFHNSDQIQNHNEGYVLPKGNKSSQWVWFTCNINAGLNTVKYTAPILISQKREPLSQCLSLLSGRHRSLTGCYPSMTLEDIVGKISWQVFLNLLQVIRNMLSQHWQNPWFLLAGLLLRNDANGMGQEMHRES